MITSICRQTGFAHLADLPCVKLCFGEASAVISLYGAQVLSYQPTPGQEVLWLSPLANWHHNTPIRGGVPVCWPWFGPADGRLNPLQQILPNHGLVRTTLWQLSAEHVAAHIVSITFEVTVSNLPGHTDAVTLQLKVSLTDQLTISLCCNTNMLQQAALHSYFKISSLPHTRVYPLPLRYIDKVSTRNVLTKTSIVEFNEEVDRVYSLTPDALTISSAERSIDITQRGQDATVVWNPWQEKSRQTKDLPDDSYLDFICVEAARLQLDAPAPLQLSQTLRCN